MKKEITVMPPDLYAERERARVHAEAMTLKTKEIRPGGEFIVNGVTVDANGRRIA